MATMPVSAPWRGQKFIPLSSEGCLLNFAIHEGLGRKDIMRETEVTFKQIAWAT